MGFAYKISDQQALHFVTATVVQWVDVFTRSAYADIVIKSLKFCCEKKGLRIFGWVIMSNHMHMICAAKDGHDLSDELRDFKKFTSTAIVEAVENNKTESRKSWLLWLLKQNDGIRFWQPGNHPEEITTMGFYKTKLDYIHQNPVRAGIVDRAEDYRYSSARDFCGVKGLLELDHFY